MAYPGGIGSRNRNYTDTWPGRETCQLDPAHRLFPLIQNRRNNCDAIRTFDIPWSIWLEISSPIFLRCAFPMCEIYVQVYLTSREKKRETTFICNCERKDESIFDLAIWSHLRSMTRSYNIYNWRKRCRIVMAHMVIVRAVLIDRKNDGNFSIIAAWEITRIDFPGISIRISVDGR